MKRTFFRSFPALLCVAALLFALVGCGAEPQPEPETETGPAELTDLAIRHEPEFGGVYIEKTIEEFNALGYAYGDSVVVTFSNGFHLTLPYYNGYYTKNGDPLLVAYPGYPYIKAAINNGDDLWEVAGLHEGDTASISFDMRGLYAAVQEARDVHYTDERNDYDSDAVFANFRGVTAGGIREGRLYRSASPCDNQHGRAPYVDALMQEAGVRFVLNLSDNGEKIEGYLADPDFQSPYFLSLYEDGAVEPIALNMNFGSKEFRQKAADGLAVMALHEGPYLVHCTEGKDRTGFLCMLLEALCGASYEEIVADYMITYDNYYHITKETEPDKYNTIVANVLDPMVASLVDSGLDFRTVDLSVYAERFLTDGGMSVAQVAALKARLTEA